MLLAPNFTERLKYLFEEVQKRSILFKAVIFFYLFKQKFGTVKL